MDRLTRKLLNSFIPARCILCKQHTFDDKSLCHYCAADLSYFDYLQFDNLLLRPDINRGIKQPQFETLISLAPYQWPWSQWISDLKFRENYNAATLMATQLASLLRYLQTKKPATLPDVILPMPIHRNRKFKRGYNQAQLLAATLAKVLCLPVDSQSLIRLKSTTAQSDLNRKQRQPNVKNAFDYKGPQHLRVALVDDVITTGATVNEVCKVLKQHNILDVSVWTICAVKQKGGR
jgi:ComF family protein